MWLLWLSCADAPDPCDGMCEAAAQLYGGCLEDWDATWQEAGYDDQADFLARCDTWAWELRLLEQDAVDRGVDRADGQVDGLCEEREAVFRGADVTCDDYTSLDWSEVPW